jgi:hypothetical protein
MMTDAIVPAATGFTLLVWRRFESDEYDTLEHPILAWQLREDGFAKPVAFGLTNEMLNEPLQWHVKCPDGRVVNVYGQTFPDQASWLEWIKRTEHPLNTARLEEIRKHAFGTEDT